MPRRPGNQTGEGPCVLAPLEATPGVRGGRPSSIATRAHARGGCAACEPQATRVPHPGAQRWPVGRSWGAPKPAPTLGFLPKRPGVERERERERSVSSADASTYRAHSGRSDSRYVCSHRTHAKTTPHHAVRPSPLLIDPLQSASDVNPADQTQPNLSVPGNPQSRCHDPKNIHPPDTFVNREPCAHTRRGGIWLWEPRIGTDGRPIQTGSRVPSQATPSLGRHVHARDHTEARRQPALAGREPAADAGIPFRCARCRRARTRCSPER
jgi:hypothetical protein